MNNASALSNLPDSDRTIVPGRLIAPGVLVASLSYFVVTSASLPGIVDPSAVIDVFLAAVIPSLVVIMLLWAARPAAYPRRRRCTLVAASLFFSAGAAAVPTWLAAI